MPFEKGKAKTGGRLLGQPNHATLEIKDFGRAIIEDPVYRERLKQRILDGEAPQIEALLYHYTYGRPKQDTDSHDPIRVLVYGPGGYVPTGNVPATNPRPALEQAAGLTDGEEG